MPANEQTWRDQKKMHIFFAISAIIMAIATIWMMAADHLREWKSWQLQDRKKDAWMLASRRDALAAQYDGQMARYAADIRQLDSQAISPEVIEAFKVRVDTGTDRDLDGGSPTTIDPADLENDSRFRGLGEKVAALEAAAESAAAARADAAAENATAEAGETLVDAEQAAIDARKAVLAEMDRFISEARRVEKALVGQKKARNGERTAAVSKLGIMVGEGASQAKRDKFQAEVINPLDNEIGDLTAQIADAKDYRLDLEALVAQAEAEKTALVKQTDTMETDLKRLDEQVYKNTSNWKEWITRWPVLNALYSGNVRIEQTWLPDLTINYNFAQAARFDRCITCHRAISTTAPGTATDPLYPTVPEEERDLTLQMATAEAPETQPQDDAGRAELIESKYGLAFSETGIINDADVTIHYVLPESPAARAGLQAGDKVVSIAGEPPYTPDDARAILLRNIKPESTMEFEVRRGLDHPFTAHPRLDLFLSDTSPHPLKDVGCTVCHDGQGSGTSFPWTSHTPDNAHEQDKWAREHGWFDNHHWIFPMRPARFVESNCLKCHHQKGGLAASERFPDPPAPKLVEGWTLVEDFGCFGCHEINGYDTPTVTVGPDLRLEPAYNEAAAAILADKNLTDDERSYAQRLREQPSDVEARDQLLAAITRDQRLANDPEAEEEARLSEDTHRLATLLKPVDMPGRMRKAGPSLRYLNSKADYDWVYSWIRLPKDFRPTTRMPQFFGQYEHLTEDPQELKESLRFEPIEIRALTEYLLSKSAEFNYVERETGVEAASAERGKWLFQSRGCLACHSHSEFPGINETQGPDLSRLAAKLNNPKGRDWLYSWLKQPNLYHARTVMPDLFLDPIAEKDPQGKPTGVVTDPAADIVEYLLSVETDWQPANVPERGQWSDAEKDDLLDLAVLWLKSDAIPAGRARQYLENGIPEEQSAKLKADERLLVNWNNDPYNRDENTRLERQLEFVARRTIGKYGCFGCHDVPGFEDAKPIGTALVDWGRKESSKLAFENIHKFLETHGINPAVPTDAELTAAKSAPNKETTSGTASTAETSAAGTGLEVHEGHLNPGEFGDADSYFIQSINSHARDGFLWQKLRNPRSYDYKMTHNKNFNERLRMPRFDFAPTVRKEGESEAAFAARSLDEESKAREAVMTFVLGLVKEPPAAKYIYKPNPRQKAIIDGRFVLDQFNCAGCHMLRAEQWQITYDGDTFESPTVLEDYPFLAPQFTDAQLAGSLAKDYRGFMHATLHGQPVTDVETGERQWVDEDLAPITPEELAEAEAEEGATIPIFYRFTLWRNALLNGQAYSRGVDELLIPAKRDGYGPATGEAFPAWGGDLPRYLFSKVTAYAKAHGSQANPNEAWGWLPPPLMDEGDKVQSDWLHEFLMDPTPIRPAVVMRMPNFHMSTDEAAQLTDYFAASSGAEFPYEYRPQQRSSYLAQVSLERQDPLAQAMNIVVDGQYCVKCHAVAEFQPQGDPYTFGPNLADVSRRLRPKFTRDWIANPLRTLHYTGMPKNIPYHSTDPSQDGVSETLYPGNSIEQLTGLVNLLMNFDVYTKSQTSVAPLVQAAAARAQAAAAAAGGATGGATPTESADGSPDDTSQEDSDQ
jgi:cytochrome c551/c552